MMHEQVEIPTSELIHFKEQVKKWVTLNKDICEYEKKIRDLKKIRNKELEPPITEFMNKYNIKDLNTENGKIKCATRNTREGLTKKNIQSNIFDVIKDQTLVDNIMEKLENRPIKTTYKLQIKN